jgi:low temperature requirement protein LtrA
MEILSAKATAPGAAGWRRHSRFVPPAATQATVPTLELFCDLVFVVAAHIVATELEHAPSLLAGAPIYFLRAFSLWNLWLLGTVMCNVAAQTDADGELDPLDYVVAFAITACAVSAARAVSEGNDPLFLTCYLLARALQTGHILVQTTRERPAHLAGEQYDRLRDLGLKCGLTFATVELLPLNGAIMLWSAPQPTIGGVPQHALALWACVPAGLTVIRFVGAVRHDLVYDTRHTPIARWGLLSTAHVSERDQLIALVFTGELLFSAATPGEPWMDTASTVAVCMGCFLLHFVCVPKGRTRAWDVGATRTMAEMYRHLFLFVALGGLGAAYPVLVHDNADAATHPGHAASAAVGAAGAPALLGSWQGCSNPGQGNMLLCISAATFLAFGALGAVTNPDPVGALAPRMGGWVRMVTRMATVLALGSLWLVPCERWPNVSLVVPALMMLSVAVELWGVQPRRPAPAPAGATCNAHLY